MRTRHATIALLLAFCSVGPATAKPVFEEHHINEQLQLFDVAGIHFGDTVEQVHATLRKAGWTQRRLDMSDEVSFADAVGKAMSARTGRPFKPSGKRAPHTEEFWKGAQMLQVNYDQHPLGTLVYKVTYQHQGITTSQAWDEFERLVDAKYSRTPLEKIGGELRCLPIDRLCRRSVENGGVISDLPSVRILNLHGGHVILEGGEAARKIFDRAVAKAVDASGELTTEF